MPPDASRCPTDGAAFETVATLPLGSRLGGYKIERLLGEGGMGFVYEATHEVLNRRTAIKMLRPELANQKQIVTRFLNEAKAVNVIDHQHIVNVYDYGDGADGSVYFVMEFLDGETLDDLLHRRRMLPLPLLLHLFAQICKALAAAHAKQIVHRDLKPANVYVIEREDNPYFVKLLDFGIAQLRGAGAVQGLTLAGVVMGTPQYMSPEQVSGGTVDARSDVWGLGVMMYRAATGRSPFEGEEFAELAEKILYQPVTPAHDIAPVPASLGALIASCLERRHEARIASVNEVLAGLEKIRKEAGLDDNAILAAVEADADAHVGQGPGPARARTRKSIAGSLPRFQGAEAAAAGAVRIVAPKPAAKSASRGRWYVLGGAMVAVLGVGGYAAFGRGAGAGPSGPAAGSAAPVAIGSADAAGSGSAAPAGPGFAAAVAAGNRNAWRALAQTELRAALDNRRTDFQRAAVEALAVIRTPATAPLLYHALGKAPAIRVRAANALGELGLPDSIDKLKEALAAAGDRGREELAGALYRLKYKDARAILVAALAGKDLPRARGAAIALAAVGEADGRAVLTEALTTLPPSGEAWLDVAEALVALGDGAAFKQLVAQRTGSDDKRRLVAAAVLARHGNSEAREQLQRQVGDDAIANRGIAALALARLGDPTPLDWIPKGLASPLADERRHALAVCAASGDTAKADIARHLPAIAKLATDDPDTSVRLTAEAALLGL